ncbi:MAG TPA: hypothetical protein VFX60_02540 [Micromonospora sp.]|nr:hypothetical protein [Micromonospora sp.]
MRRSIWVTGLAVMFAVGSLALPAAAAPPGDEAAADSAVDELVAAFAGTDRVVVGTPLGCLLETVVVETEVKEAGEVDIQHGIDICKLISFDKPGQLDEHMLTGPSVDLFSPGPSYHGTVACQSGVDPRLGDGYRLPPLVYYLDDPGYLDQNYAPGRRDGPLWDTYQEYQEAADEADEAWREFKKLERHGYKSSKDPEEQREFEKARDDANKALEKRDSFRPLVSSGEKPGEIPAGGANATPSGEDICAEMMNFVTQCNEINWMAPACQDALNRMRNCDSLVAYPHPDEGEACQEHDRPDPQMVQAVLALVCSMTVKPAPGEEPCAAAVIDAEVLRGYVPTKEGGPACGSPLALTTADQCTPTMTVISPQQRWQAYVAEALARVGGKGFVIPVPNQYTGGPGQPRTCDPDRGEPC